MRWFVFLVMVFDQRSGGSAEFKSLSGDGSRTRCSWEEGVVEVDFWLDTGFQFRGYGGWFNLLEVVSGACDQQTA